MTEHYYCVHDIVVVVHCSYLVIMKRTKINENEVSFKI